MKPPQRVVVDHNVLISRLLLASSVPGRAVRRVVDRCQLLISEPVLLELAAVLARRKFDRYLSLEERQEFVRLVGRVAEMVPIVYAIRACRDPEDDKFLELAVNGSADLILTGDRDLLELHPFRGIPVITPAAFLAGRW